MARKSKSRKRSLPRWQIVLIAVFGIIIIGVLGVLVAGLLQGMFRVPQTDVAALVNGESITMRELEYSYRSSIPEPYQQFVSKWQFLNASAIPQKLLLQEAERHDFSASWEEVDAAIASFLAESGMTLGQFEKEVKDSAIRMEDVRDTLRARITISKFVNATILPGIMVGREDIEKSYKKNNFEGNNISIEQAYGFLENQLRTERMSEAILRSIVALRENANITIFIEQAKEGITSFRKNGNEPCIAHGGIRIRMFTSSSCKECASIASRLGSLLRRYGQQNASFAGEIWELDTGDNLLTKEKEKGVPSSEVAFFKRMSPESKVPAYSFGCVYTRVGNLPGAEGNLNAEESEFTSVLDTLLYDHG